jgi:ribosome-interacting GTPase 1
MSGDNSTFCFSAMKEEIKSLAKIQVCDLVDLPKGVVSIGCKWVLQNLKGCFWVMLNNIKIYLKPMILLKRKALIIMNEWLNLIESYIKRIGKTILLGS